MGFSNENGNVEINRWHDSQKEGSNYGNLIDIYAPGENIPVQTEINKYGVENGTSFAAAFVSGAAALLWSFDPTLTAAEVKDYLIRGAQQGGIIINNPDASPIPTLSVYESLKLIAAERPDVPACGMFGIADWSPVDRNLSLWRLVPPGADTKNDEIFAERSRSYTVPFSADAISTGEIGIEHGFRSTVAAFWEEFGPNNWLHHLYRYDFLNLGHAEIPIDGSFSGVRPMADGRILTRWSSQGISERWTVLPDENILLTGGQIYGYYQGNSSDAYSFSHDRSLYTFEAGRGLDYDGDGINDEIVFDTIQMVRLPLGSGDPAAIAHAENIDDFVIRDIIISPRGDAIAFSLDDTEPYPYRLFLYKTDLELYNFPTAGKLYQIDLMQFGNDPYIWDMKFTNDGNGILVSITYEDECKLLYVDVENQNIRLVKNIDTGKPVCIDSELVVGY
jgi:hypothetical protein